MAQLINVVGGDEPVQVEFPDDMSREEIEAQLRANFPAPERSTSQVTVDPASRPSTVSEEFRRSLENYGGSWRTLIDSFDNAEDAAVKGIELQDQLSQKYGRPVTIEETIDAFQNDGVISAAAQIAKDAPRAVVGQVPHMAVMLAGTKFGSAAGLRAFGKTPQTAAIGAGAGAIIGGAGAVYPMHYAQNIMRQAEADLDAGREVDVNRLTAATAAVAQSGLEYGSMLFMLGKGAIRKALGVPFKATEAAAAQKLLDASRRSLGSRALRGAGRGVVAEVPTELSQQVIERSQAGLDLMSDDAIKEYGEIIYQTALVAPVFGGVAGAIQRTPAPRTQPQIEDLSAVRPAGEISEIAEAAAAADLSAVESAPEQITPTTLERAAAETAASPEDLAIRQATQEKIRQITPILEETLKGRGLDDVGFRLSQSLTNIADMRDPEQVQAVFDPDVRTIFLAADRVAGFEGMAEPQLRTELAGLLDHEMVHAMKNMGLWNTSEWNVLESTVQNRTNRQGVTYMDAAKARYQAESPAIQREEAVAELIRDTFGGRSGVAGRPLNLIRRIIEFFRKLGNSITGSGFASFNQIVSDIETGVIGARDRITGGIPEPMAAARRVRPDVEVQQYLPLGKGLTAEELAIDRAVVEDRKKRQASAKIGIAQAREILAEDPKKAARSPTIEKAKAGGFGDLGRLLNEWRTSQVPPLEPLGTEDVIAWFHGTPNRKRILDEGFQTFVARGGSESDPIFWFSTARPIAQTYKPQRETRYDPDPAIMEVYLRGKNPLIFDAEGDMWNSLRVGTLMDTVDNPEGLLKAIRKSSQTLLYDMPTPTISSATEEEQQLSHLYSNAFRDQEISSERVARIARDMGYDGVIFNRMRDIGPEYYGYTDESGTADFPTIPEQALEETGASTVMALFRPRVSRWTRGELPDAAATRIRSPEAAFDPEARESRNILAARGPTMGALTEFVQQKIPPSVEEKARIARARQQGFDTDRVWYHGTPNEFMEFDQEIATERIRPMTGGYFNDLGFFFSNKRKYPSALGDVIPVYSRVRNPWRGDLETLDQFLLDKNPAFGFTLGERQTALQELGYDGVIADLTGYSSEKGEEWLIAFNPNDVRSIRAEFDPERTESANLMAARDPNRDARAKQLGFDTSQVYYHFTSRFEEAEDAEGNLIKRDFTTIQPSESGAYGPGIYLSGDPEFGDIFARVWPTQELEGLRKYGEGSRGIPVYIRGRMASYSDLERAEKQAAEAGGSLGTRERRATEILQEEGFTGIIPRRFDAEPIVVIFDPQNVRSVNAEFDPQRTESANLLASRKSDLVQSVREKADQRIAEEVAQGKRRRNIIKIEDIAISLDEDHLATYGRKLDPTVTEDQLIAAKVIADDIDQQMTNDVSGQGWYDADVEKAFMLLSQIPGLESLRTNEDHRVIWSAIAGPTSNNQKVIGNTRAATAAMLSYLRTGKIPTVPPTKGVVTEGIPNAGWGSYQGAVASGMKVVSKLVDTHGEAGFADWWLSPHSLKELTEIRKEAGLSGPPSGLSGGRDSDHLGAMVIGDKTGRFSLNINGYEGTTKDVWYVRSYNRVFGQMFGNTGEVQGSPRNLTERRQMEAFNQLVLDNVKEEGLSEADAQAILWFHEQILYTELGVVSRPESFSEGVEAIHDTLKIRPRVRGSDESQAEVESAEALADWRAISPSERISRWERYQTETQPSAELKTSPEQSDALAADKLKAARENRYANESDQAAQNAVAAARKLASRSDVSDISRNIAYEEVAAISAKRAARGLGNAQTALSWEAPTSAHDWGFVYNVQDKFIDLAKTEEAISKGLTGQGLTPLSAIASPYKGEESMHGIIKNQMREFEDTELEPLVEKLIDLNIDRTELDNFLILRHAVERNAHIREINSKKSISDAALEDGGAGSIYNEQTQQAERLLDDYVKGRMLNEYGFRWNDSTNRWEGGNQRGVQLEGIAKDYDEITKGTLKILQRDGLISDKDYDFLSTYYNYYAPLRGQRIDDDIAAEEHHRAGTGVGNLGIRGTEIETATGRVSVAFPPTGSTVSKRLDAIVRGSKNVLVGQRLLDLVRNYPNADYWDVFSEIPSSLATARELFGVKEGGKQFYIQLHDRRLKEALLNLDAPQAHKIIRGLGALNRVLSFMSTSLNPPFIISNFLKDGQMAMYTLAGEQTMEGGRAVDAKGLHGQVIADLLPSVRQVYRGLRGKKLTPELQKEWDDYLASGAKTEWFHAQDPEQSLKTIDDMIAMANGSFKGTTRNAWNATGDFISHLNSAVENGIRFAVFKKARAMMIKNGIDPVEATARSASLSKNLTVNFNRKGNQGQFLNSLYLFFNASVQGTANVIRAVKNSRTVQSMAAGATTLAAMLTLLNEASSEEDEFGESYYDNIQDFEKERNIIIMKTIFFPETGDPKRAYKIPLPWGFNVFWLFGVNMAEMSMGQKSVQQASTDMLGAAIGSFSPLGFGQSRNIWNFGLKGVTPQVFKPFLEIALNENFFGGPIYRENFDFGLQLPLSNLSMPRTPEAFKATTEFMNAITGGNESEWGLTGGLSPDMLRHFFNTYTGGAGRFVERAATYPSKLVSGDDIPVNEIPFVRRLLVDSDYRENQSEYYERRDDILAKSNQVRVERGADRTEYIEKNRGYLRMKRFLDNADKMIRRINARLNDLDDRMLRADSPEMRLRIQGQQEKLQEQKQRIYGRFNKRFNEAIEKTK